MKSALARVGALGVDCVQGIDAAHAAALKASGVDFAVRYLGSVTAPELAGIVAAGLAFMPVTFADRFDGAIAAGQCKAVGLPAGCTVWLDVEGQSVWSMDPTALQGKINDWADAITAAGFQPGLYVGAPQPLSSAELYSLHVVRYWRGQGRVVDRAGMLAEPTCGWCMSQMFPSVTRAGVWTDIDVVGADYQSRLPTWAVS